MRIAMISTPFLAVPPLDYGGTELVVYELAEGLIEQGHQVTLFATGDSMTRAELKFLYSSSQWPPHPLAEVNHLSWSMAQVLGERFDLVHVHCPAALPLARLMPPLPLVCTLHHEREQATSELYRQFPHVYFISISESQRRLEVPLPRCEVIHHGLDAGRFDFTERPAEYVCFLGRFSQVKGPHLAIDVAARAGLPIWMAGRPHPQDEAFADRELAARLSLPHVRLIGCVNHARKVPLLRHARALLGPIEWEEPFGLAFIEAMLCGCPVVAFPRGSLPELIDPGVTGYLVDTPQEMAEVIRPGGPLDRFDRQRCRQRATERFSRQRLVADHLHLYQRVIAERDREVARARMRPPVQVT